VGNDGAYFSKGLRLFKKGNVRAALLYFKRDIRAHPGRAESHYYLGLCRSRLGKNQEAARALEKARDLNPDLPALYLNMGIVYYKLEDYESAILVLKKAIEKDPKDASSLFFMGLSYQGDGEYEKSISPFEKAGKLDPDYTQPAWYYIGVAYYNVGREDDAREAFKKAINADPKSETAAVTRDLLNSLEAKGIAKKKTGKKWWLKGSGGAEYDDNLTEEESDTATGWADWAAVFEFEGGYRFVNSKPFEAEITYDFYQSFYEIFEESDEDISDMNTQTHTAGLSASVDLDKWDIGLDYDYTYMFLGGDSFMQTHSISPSVGWLAFPILYGNVSYIFSINDYFNDEDELRDAVNHSAGFDLFLFFMDYKGYVQVGYRAEIEDADGDEYDYLGHTAICAVQVKLPYESTIRFMYQYEFKDYSDITPSIGEEREDNKHTYNAVFTKELFDNFELKVDYEHIRSYSNLPAVDYHENVIYMGLSFFL
jgi:tetratricopeptide (TPR) repeat protein